MFTDSEYFGIVMPDGFSTHMKYQVAIETAVARYSDVELLKLPEGIFRKAGVGAEVLIAQHLRPEPNKAAKVRLRQTTVSRADWSSFQHTLRPSVQVKTEVNPIEAPGLTGLRPLRDLWKAVAHLPKLGGIAELHRGLEWTDDQALASRARPAEGFKPGLHLIAGSIDQFRVLRSQYLDCRPSKLRGGAVNLAWDHPKVVCNAIRTSRGVWRLAAAVDMRGLVVSQQFFGIWLKQSAPANPIELLRLACILNSPFANAYSYCHDAQKGLRVSTMAKLPLPPVSISASIVGLVREYWEAVSKAEPGPLFAVQGRSATEILMEIDAQVLAAYDLPPRLERELLRFMNAGDRPCAAAFGGYPGTEANAGAIPLIHRVASKGPERAASWEAIKRPLASELADVFDMV